MRHYYLTLLYMSLAITATAQSKLNLTEGLSYKVEAQSSASNGNTPLWLNANKYGLSSIKSSNGYLRGSLERPLTVDSLRKWSIGYGLDIAVPYNYTSSFVVQQAYADLRFMKARLTIGSKQEAAELKNNRLSSGAQTLGINARPVPQVKLSLPDYYTLPFFGRWVSLKGHVAYGMLTDDGWQHDFNHRQQKHTDNVLYHSKAGYIKIGKDDKPFSVDAGLEMGAIFGGTAYISNADGTMQVIKNKAGLSSFWNVFIPGGQDVEDGDIYGNKEGDDLGSWLLRLNYKAPFGRVSLYADKFFEDHSGMFLLDYDGYGKGEEFNEWKDNRYFMYSLKDIMLGAELNLSNSFYIKNIVVEYLYTKYQSGPVYHDRTYTISDHIAGNDDYYNHGVLNGWQHWGQVMGNPLYRSPIYNTDGTIYVKNNRFVAWHLGIDGNIMPQMNYRVLASWQEGLGRYTLPYTHARHNFSVMAETTYQLPNYITITGGIGFDCGSILGRNQGLQITISKLFN